MADDTQTSEASPEGKHKNIIYRASGARKTIFSFLFLILLPFFISLPAMLIMRLQNGLISDAIGHAIMAVAFTLLMILILYELIFSLRARIELGEKKVHMTLPAARGPTPKMRYKSYDIPYEDIQTVETRREIYGRTVAPVLLQGARIVTKNGDKIPIGYVSEANVDPTFPYPEIARQIAERARLPLINRGNVWRSFRRKFLGFGVKSSDESDIVDDTQIASLNRGHKNFVGALICGLLVLLALGVVQDLSSDLPIGQTASAIVNN